MAYLQLRSNNPNFSYILEKNPASGMNIKSCRKGRIFGWYSGPGVYNIYFRDSDIEVSYGNDDFEYMDATQYNAPLFLINAFHGFLNHMRKADDKDIIGYENVLYINQMRCKKYNLEEFKSHFSEYDFSFDEVAINNFRIAIKTKNTIRELVNLGQLFAIFNALLSKDIYITDDEIDKYMSCLGVVDAPYFIRHLFKCNFLREENVFKKYKALLEKSEKAKLEFELGYTIDQRISAIKRHLDFKSHIVDIGCGDGTYVREFAPRLSKRNLEYHAIDINPDSIEAVMKMCKRKEIENVATWSSVDEFVCPNNSDIIMTEVIEHMNKDDAALLIKKILQWPFKSLIITTPNKEFNYNYKLLEDDVRNEDHKFEFAKEEFKNWIEENIEKRDDISIRFFEIGDKVNDLQITLAAILGKDNGENHNGGDLK